MPRRVLIVDDSAINREMLSKALSGDYDVIEAENGKEALALIHRYYKSLSAVLLDIMMPELDGYEVLERIRDNAPLSQIPIIVVTGVEDQDARLKALSLGANDFILKPFNPEIVKHCLRNNIALRETASILNAIQTDKLTGLYNREAFFERVNAHIARQPSGYYVLSCFDIDNFKLINDQYGTAVGDRILHDIGKAIKKGLAGTEGFASRINADNFAALIPTERQDTEVIRKVLDKNLIDFEYQPISYSAGRYVITDLTLPASAIYDRAYIAKQSVKGRYDKRLAYFDEVMLHKLVHDQQIVGDMETALREKQFEVWFQPQYNHSDGSVIGAEALVRWRHPAKGIIPPNDFIPLFEKNGFVYEMDKFVWSETCRYLRKWTDEGLEPLPVSVNVSRYDIYRADFIDTITGIVEEYGIPVRLLRLEVTETAFATSTKHIVGILEKLEKHGFTIEIDDFGSGYSSLNILKSVPAQIVKLDMRFLQDENDAQRGGSIIESVVRMIKWLGMTIIAEGVETVEQGDFLKSIGCSYVQGYLYARPMPAKDYEESFRNARKEECAITLETVTHLDNNMFWDPSSMDTLIFNSYVGAACIFEYHNGNLELLRATDKFAQMLGGDAMTVDELLKLDISRYLDGRTGVDLVGKLNASARSKAEITCELMFRDLPGCPHHTYLRSNMRVIAIADDRYLVYCISDNITAQRASERQERHVTKQLQMVMDNINIGITAECVTGDDTEFLLSNGMYYELLGYTVEQYNDEIGNKTFSIVCPEDRQRVIGVVNQTINTGTPTTVEYRAFRRDGSVIWLRSCLSMSYFEDIGNPVLLSTYADVTTERHMAQDLVENLPCGAGICAITDNDVYMTYLNKRFMSYFKSDSWARSMTSLFSAVHPDDVDVLKRAIRPKTEICGEGSCVVRILDEPGEYITFRISGIALKSIGKVDIIYVTFMPVSDGELSISEMLYVDYKRMMSSPSSLSFIKDKNLKYVCCSPSFAYAAGLQSENDIAGKSDYDLFDKELADKYTADDRRLLAGGEPIISVVESYTAPDGTCRYSNTTKYLIYDSHGNVVGLYGVGEDITETREAEIQHEFLINSIPGGVAIFEGEYGSLESVRIKYYSDGFCGMLGYTREEYEQSGASNPTALIAKEDVPGLVEQVERLVETHTPIDYVYRSVAKDGSYRWVHIKAVLSEQHGARMSVNAVFFDVTERHNIIEQLRISEEENRIAISHGKNVVCRYDVATRSLRVSPGVSTMLDMPPIIEDVPYGQVRLGVISPETADAYIAFFEDILSGEKAGNTVFLRKSTSGWRWVEAHSSTILSTSGEPVSAIISYTDVTDSYEKDVVYKKWFQSLRTKDPDSYSLHRCNVSKKLIFPASEGSLIASRFNQESQDIDGFAVDYAVECVVEEDIESFKAFLDTETLLDRYAHGELLATLEYREHTRGDAYRWLSLTVDMFEYTHSLDVEAYMLFKDIDESKRAELLTLERAENDPLTGILNRATFEEKVNELIRSSSSVTKHAMLMMDIDNFKQVNDTFGHAAGDQTLLELANTLRSISRREDLLGRLGGDEFVLFLNNIPGEAIAASKARRICELTRKAYSADVQISGSVGIALYPNDGTDFETLYKKADETLYHVKETGKDSFAFYQASMRNGVQRTARDGVKPVAASISKKKNRMLIVDDSKIDYEFLANMFKNDFIVERAKNGDAALVRLRYFGTAVSVVLLDLMMPGMDGFAVLEELRRSPETRDIPVVVVSGSDDRETSLRAIRGGASDYVIKPVDPDVLRIRVQSAVSKAENERLRAMNSYLEMQNDEAVLNKVVLQRLQIAVVEMDWRKSTFTYNPSISKYIAGTYDSRTLWHILLSDLVADTNTVKSIQRLLHEVAEDRERIDGSAIIKLKTPSGKRQRFCLDIYKITNDYGLTSKMILTFRNVEAEMSEPIAPEDDEGQASRTDRQ